MALDTKAVLDEMNNVWAQMKTSLDEAKAEVKQYGAHTGELELKLTRMEGRLDQLETELKRLPTLVGGVQTTDEKAAEAAEKKRVYFEVLRKNGVSALEEEDQALAKKWHLGPVGVRDIKALNLADDTTGGFLAPVEYVQEIIQGVQLISPIRQIATVRRTGRRAVDVPVRAGVPTAQWIGETATRTETTGLALSMEEITAYEMYAEILVSEQDLEDVQFDFEGFMRDNIAEQFAKAEGTAFVKGTGLKQPQGFMNRTGISQFLSGHADTIASAAAGSPGQGDGLVDFVFGIKTAYAANATLTLNRKSVGKVRKLADSQGRYLWEPGYANGTGVIAPANILGIPYVETPDMDDEGNGAFPIAMGDFKRACIVLDRVDMVVKRLNEKYAEQGQIAFLARKRVGFSVVLPEAIIKYKSDDS